MVTPSAALRKLVTLESALSRAATSSAPTPSAAPACPVRRAWRTSSRAVSSTRTSASGATTVVMSRPSATMPRPSENESEASSRAIVARWAAISRWRTGMMFDTFETWVDTSVERIASLMSSPSHSTRGSSGSTVMSKWSPVKNSPTVSVTSRSSTSCASRSTPRFRHHQAQARYIAPVSR